ncbi:uracil-5--methyltransferase [Xylariales sp. PMI_506]|nr:uracil-5--methyltransferase [Xylariales sp. PMI_506]
MASPAVSAPQGTTTPHAGARQGGAKRPFQQQQQKGMSKRRAKKRERDMKTGSHEEVLALDIKALRAAQVSSSPAPEGAAEGAEAGVVEETLPVQGTEIEVEVVELSSTGDGLAQQKGSKHIYVVPFVVPGDTARVKVWRHHAAEGYTDADFLSVVKPSENRDDSRIRCKYFAKCAGCQFQMLDYPEQLRLKRRIVDKAFRNFSQLPPELVPPILDTMGSPLQYGYRTKLTPHFDGPKGWNKRERKYLESKPNVGFNPKVGSATIDIEDCPIGTEAVLMGMKSERQRMETEYSKYYNGGTILLRESTKRVPKSEAESSQPRSPSPESAIKVETEKFTDYKTCITDNNGTSTEYIDDYKFTNPAGSFFQNNNSILPSFTDYIRQHILPRPTADGDVSPVKYLIDAYSGSGLFTITLSSMFQSSTGIDIDPKSISFARKNAENNNLPESQANFMAADARELFKSVQYDPDETVVVLDPPRKGCDASFLGQLLRFGPRRVVYVSCNVHTQARDVGILVTGETGESAEDAKQQEQGGKKVRYDIESIRGFDFFPQTGHVEGVAVLNRVEVTPTES